MGYLLSKWGVGEGGRWFALHVELGYAMQVHINMPQVLNTDVWCYRSNGTSKIILNSIIHWYMRLLKEFPSFRLVFSQFIQYTAVIIHFLTRSLNAPNRLIIFFICLTQTLKTPLTSPTPRTNDRRHSSYILNEDWTSSSNLPPTTHKLTSHRYSFTHLTLVHIHLMYTDLNSTQNCSHTQILTSLIQCNSHTLL